MYAVGVPAHVVIRALRQYVADDGQVAASSFSASSRSPIMRWCRRRILALSRPVCFCESVAGDGDAPKGDIATV